MSFRPACHLILLAALLATAPTVVAAQTETDRQASAVLEARQKNPDEVKSILARLSNRQKDDLVRQQAIIDGLLRTSTDPSALSSDDKERLWNATKVIDSIIAGNTSIADGQLICRQEKKIGTQLAKRNCRTKAQIERDREQAGRELGDAQREIQTRR